MVKLERENLPPGMRGIDADILRAVWQLQRNTQGGVYPKQIQAMLEVDLTVRSIRYRMKKLSLHGLLEQIGGNGKRRGYIFRYDAIKELETADELPETVEIPRQIQGYSADILRAIVAIQREHGTAQLKEIAQRLPEKRHIRTIWRRVKALAKMGIVERISGPRQIWEVKFRYEGINELSLAMNDNDDGKPKWEQMKLWP